MEEGARPTMQGQCCKCWAGTDVFAVGWLSRRSACWQVIVAPGHPPPPRNTNLFCRHVHMHTKRHESWCFQARPHSLERLSASPGSDMVDHHNNSRHVATKLASNSVSWQWCRNWFLAIQPRRLRQMYSWFGGSGLNMSGSRSQQQSPCGN